MNLSKPYPYPHQFVEKKCHGREIKRIVCRLKGKLRTEQGQHRTKKTTKDYRQTNRADLGQAEDKKGLAKGSHRGKAQFYKKIW